MILTRSGEDDSGEVERKYIYGVPASDGLMLLLTLAASIPQSTLVSPLIFNLFVFWSWSSGIKLSNSKNLQTFWNVKLVWLDPSHTYIWATGSPDYLSAQNSFKWINLPDNLKGQFFRMFSIICVKAKSRWTIRIGQIFSYPFQDVEVFPPSKWCVMAVFLVDLALA